jgi:hypothetical protein
MHQVDLAFVAEALLEMCATERKPLFYTEYRYKKKLRREQRREPVYEIILRQHGHDPLLESECRGVYGSAGLTARQLFVVEMRVAGHTFDEIGKALGNTKQATQHIFVLALKKIANAFHVYPYTGMSDVYRSETRRGRS